MRFADFDLSQHILVIAELGNNHEGDPDAARGARLHWIFTGTIPDDEWFAYVCQLDPCEACRAEGYQQPKDGWTHELDLRPAVEKW